jgi:hypothetical protein
MTKHTRPTIPHEQEPAKAKDERIVELMQLARTERAIIRELRFLIGRLAGKAIDDHLHFEHEEWG